MDEKKYDIFRETLKDMNIECPKNENGSNGISFEMEQGFEYGKQVTLEMSRNMAKGWLSRFKKYNARRHYSDARKGRGIMKFTTVVDDEWEIPQVTSDWIKHVFNLTEEDINGNR